MWIIWTRSNTPSRACIVKEELCGKHEWDSYSPDHTWPTGKGEAGWTDRAACLIMCDIFNIRDYGRTHDGVDYADSLR